MSTNESFELWLSDFCVWPGNKRNGDHAREKKRARDRKGERERERERGSEKESERADEGKRILYEFGSIDKAAYHSPYVI